MPVEDAAMFLDGVDQLNLNEAPDIAVQCESGESPWWFQVLGAKVSGGLGIRPIPCELNIRSSTNDLVQVLAGKKQGWQAAMNLHSARPGGSWAPLCPFDVGPQGTEAERFPVLDLTVQHLKTGSPVGVLAYFDVFVEGCFVGRHGGLAASPDATIENGFERMVRGFDLDADFLDSISGVQIECADSVKLMVIGGLYESLVLREHFGRRHHENRLLCALSRVTQSDAWKGALVEIRSDAEFE